MSINSTDNILAQNYNKLFQFFMFYFLEVLNLIGNVFILDWRALQSLFVCDVNKPVDAHLSKRSLLRQ